MRVCWGKGQCDGWWLGKNAENVPKEEVLCSRCCATMKTALLHCQYWQQFIIVIPCLGNNNSMHHFQGVHHTMIITHCIMNPQKSQPSTSTSLWYTYQINQSFFLFFCVSALILFFIISETSREKVLTSRTGRQPASHTTVHDEPLNSQHWEFLIM